MMLTIIIEIIGWMAAVAVIAAYALISAGKLGGQSRIYQWMNIGGALGLVINTAWHGAWPSTAVNIIWAGIGGAALWRIATRKGSSTSAT